MSALNLVTTFSFNKSIRFLPLYDVHVGAPTFDEGAFLKTIDYIKRNDYVYWALDGDCIENIIANCVAPATDQTITPTEQVKYLIDKLSPIRERGKYIIRGNHSRRTEKQAYYDILTGMARELKINYLNTGGYVRFKVGNQTYTIATQHGESGAQNWEIEMKKLRNNYPEAELFLEGHDHSLHFEYKPYESIDRSGQIQEKYVIFGRCGNFLGYADYAKARCCERKITGNLNIKFHADQHLITGYRMMYVNGNQIVENNNNIRYKNGKVIQEGMST